MHRSIRNVLPGAGLCLLLLALPACRSPARLAPADFSEPGWTTRQGQAIWRAKAGAPEIAGELLLATHADGRTFLQFTKTPIPLIIARTTGQSWQVEFVAENRTVAGRGDPPARLGWLQVGRCLFGFSPPKCWAFEQTGDGRWRLENRRTGELLQGYLAR